MIRKLFLCSFVSVLSAFISMSLCYSPFQMLQKYRCLFSLREAYNNALKSLLNRHSVSLPDLVKKISRIYDSQERGVAGAFVGQGMFNFVTIYINSHISVYCYNCIVPVSTAHDYTEKKTDIDGITITGKYKLAEGMTRFKVQPHVWAQKSEEDRSKAIAKFYNQPIPSSSTQNLVTSKVPTLVFS